MFSINKIALLCALLGVCVARPQYGGEPAGYSGGPGGEAGMPYDFQWAVQDPETGNDYSHQQSSDGVSTQGQYRVLLPDGRIQTVTFVDNGNGYEAQVSYEGEARFPAAASNTYSQSAAGGGGYGAPPQPSYQ